MTIVAAHSVSDFFHEVVEDAIKAQRVDATEAQRATSSRSSRTTPTRTGGAGETLERPLTLLLDEALHAPDPAERFQRLRVLGDGVLYGCGFFGDHFEARGVDAKYLRGLGTRAYGAASSMLRRGPERRRAPRTRPLRASSPRTSTRSSSVLAEVADATIAMGVESSRGLLKVYERWLKTGSERLASALTSRGVVPTRGTQGRPPVSGADAGRREATASSSCASARWPRASRRARAALPPRPRRRRRGLRPRRRTPASARRCSCARRTTATLEVARPRCRRSAEAQLGARRALPDHRGREPLRLRRRARARAGARRRSSSSSCRPRSTSGSCWRPRCARFDVEPERRRSGRASTSASPSCTTRRRGRARARRAVPRRQRRGAPASSGASSATTSGRAASASCAPSCGGSSTSARKGSCASAAPPEPRFRLSLGRPVRIDKQVREAVDRLELPFNALGRRPVRHLRRPTCASGARPSAPSTGTTSRSRPAASSTCRRAGARCSSATTRAASRSTRAMVVRLVPPRDGPAAPRAGHGREVHQPLALLGSWASRTGQLTGLPEHAERLLEDDRLLMVFPEGARGTAKLFRERNSLVDFGIGLRAPRAEDEDAHRPLRGARRRRGVPHRRERVQARAAVRRALHAHRRVRAARRRSRPRSRSSTARRMRFEGTGNEDDEIVLGYVDKVKEAIAGMLDRRREAPARRAAAARPEGTSP